MIHSLSEWNLKKRLQDKSLFRVDYPTTHDDISIIFCSVQEVCECITSVHEVLHIRNTDDMCALGLNCKNTPSSLPLNFVRQSTIWYHNLDVMKAVPGSDS